MADTCVPIHALAEAEKCAGLLDSAGNLAGGVFAQIKGRSYRVGGPERLGKERVLGAGFGMPGALWRNTEGGIRHQLCAPRDGGEVSVAWVAGVFHFLYGGSSMPGISGWVEFTGPLFIRSLERLLDTARGIFLYAFIRLLIVF